MQKISQSLLDSHPITIQRLPNTTILKKPKVRGRVGELDIFNNNTLLITNAIFIYFLSSSVLLEIPVQAFYVQCFLYRIFRENVYPISRESKASKAALFSDREGPRLTLGASHMYVKCNIVPHCFHAYHYYGVTCTILYIVLYIGFTPVL